MKTTKISKKIKNSINHDIIALLNILNNDEDLGYNSLAGVISCLRTTASSLEIKAKKLSQEREKLEKLPL